MAPLCNITGFGCAINWLYVIVAKVDELMALCDALKARINEAKTTQIHLADAIVD